MISTGVLPNDLLLNITGGSIRSLLLFMTCQILKLIKGNVSQHVIVYIRTK